MKDIEKIRIDNLFIIKAETGESFKAMAKKAAITPAYLSGIKNGVHPFTAANARRFETAYEKHFGWMDKDNSNIHEEAYSQIALKIAIKTIEDNDRLKMIYEETDNDGKAEIMNDLYVVFTDKAMRDLPSSSINAFIGVANENKLKKKDKKEGGGIK